MVFLCFVFCWLELLRREIHTESKMVRLTLLVLDTVKHGMSRRRSVISIMVAHYKTGIQYLKLWHTKIYTLLSQNSSELRHPPPLQYIQYFYYLWGKTELENVFVCFGSLQHTNNNRDIGIWDPMFNCISNRLEGMTF